MAFNIESRLASCWKIQDCGTCINSKHGCGWCPHSSACVPASSLFDPIRNKDVCPHWSERWELRTKALGCGCSTTTLLAVLITILCTIVGLFVLYGLWKVMIWANRLFGPGSYGGWSLEIDDDGHSREGIWIRRRWWLPLFKSAAKSEYKVEERETLLSRRRD